MTLYLPFKGAIKKTGMLFKKIIDDVISLIWDTLYNCLSCKKVATENHNRRVRALLKNGKSY